MLSVIKYCALEASGVANSTRAAIMVMIFLIIIGITGVLYNNSSTLPALLSNSPSWLEGRAEQSVADGIISCSFVFLLNLQFLLLWH